MKHFEDFELRIPRDEIIEIETKAKETIKSLDENYKMTICYVELYDKKYHGDNNLEGHYISIWEPLSLNEFFIYYAVILFIDCKGHKLG